MRIEVDVFIRKFIKRIEISVNIWNFTKWIEISLIIRIVRFDHSKYSLSCVLGFPQCGNLSQPYFRIAWPCID